MYYREQRYGQTDDEKFGVSKSMVHMVVTKCVKTNEFVKWNRVKARTLPVEIRECFCYNKNVM